jgi:hypothetical protein
MYFNAFPSPHFAESGLIWVTYLLSTVRNHMDAVKRGDFRLSPTTPQPDLQVFTRPKEHTECDANY